MGLFGGGNSKTENLTENQESVFNNVDNRLSDGSGIVDGNLNINAVDSSLSNLNITKTDYGAIDSGMNVVLAGLDLIGETNAVANQQTMQSIDKSFALASESAKNDTTEITQDFIKYGAIILIGGGLLFVVAKKFKK